MQSEKEARKRWRKLLTMIGMVQALSPSSKDDMMTPSADLKEDGEKSCWELLWLDKYVKTPDALYMTVWTMISLIINLISILLVFYQSSFLLATESKRSNV